MATIKLRPASSTLIPGRLLPFRYINDYGNSNRRVDDEDERGRRSRLSMRQRSCSVFVAVVVLFRPVTASHSTFQSRVSPRDVHTEHVEFKSADSNRNSMTRARRPATEKSSLARSRDHARGMSSKRTARIARLITSDNKVQARTLSPNQIKRSDVPATRIRVLM